jgi:hypothetical protein
VNGQEFLLVQTNMVEGFACLGFKRKTFGVSPQRQEAKWLRGLDLNQRPLGYEPNELPDCSTPHIYYRIAQSICQDVSNLAGILL